MGGEKRVPMNAHTDSIPEIYLLACFIVVRYRKVPKEAERKAKGLLVFLCNVRT